MITRLRVLITRLRPRRALRPRRRWPDHERLADELALELGCPRAGVLATIERVFASLGPPHFDEDENP